MTQLPIRFDSTISTRVIFGANSLEQIGGLTHELGAKTVLLVTDAGIVAAGHAARTLQLLRSAGRSVALFDAVEENPTTRIVDDCVMRARAAQTDCIIGLGGGSSLDVAKGCNFLLTNGGRMQDYWGFGKATQPMLPFIAIPTTAGTGSECQSYALIADEKTHRKMACGDPKAAARIAILDPLLTLTQPRAVTAATGMDAIAHAVESAVTKKRNEVSWKFSREAFRLCVENFPLVLKQPDNLDARAAMQLGAAYAGAAIENSMLGAAHSAANPLTAHYGVVHGVAVGLMLPHVVRFNAEDEATAKIYRELAGEDAEALAERLKNLLLLAGLPRRLHDCGVSVSPILNLSQEAAREWTAQFNPRPVTSDDFAALYEAAL